MSSEELTVLKEIKDVLTSIDDRLAYQSKLMEDLYLAKDELQKNRMQAIEGPMNVLQGILNNALSKMPDGPQKEQMSNMKDMMKNLGGVEK
jgi:hypothetical protein